MSAVRVAFVLTLSECLSGGLSGCWVSEVSVKKTAALGEPCQSAQAPDAPMCDKFAGPGIRCLTSSTAESSLCAPACQNADDASCQGWFPGGCCLFAGELESCLPAEFCDPPKKPPGAICASKSECEDRFGSPACVKVGDEPARCSFECFGHDQCRAVFPGGCCFNSQGTLGIICISAEQAGMIGVSCP
ncbi:MAG: hypothetical protein HY791_34035 [Deltaproteobacteria bacterium]|nr:hypothetical protein [Deltaproteobacteria bacterium]